MAKPIIIDRQHILAMSEADLASKPAADLLELRQYAASTADPELQNKLAGAVHRDYVHNIGENGGAVGVLANVVGAPIYAGLKSMALNADDNNTNPLDVANSASRTAKIILDQVPGGNITKRTSEPGLITETGSAWRGARDWAQGAAVRAGTSVGNSLRETFKRVFGD